MKILIMDTLKFPGKDGCTVHRWELVRNLSQLGCEIHAMAHTNTKPEGVCIHLIAKKGKIRYIIQLIKLIKQYRYDVMYSRNIMISAIGLLIKKKVEIKISA